MTGWPEKCDEEELKPYHIRSQELSCEQSCVLWGSNVIIPQVFREKMLIKRIALGTPWHPCNEGHSPHLCLVAKDG